MVWLLVFVAIALGGLGMLVGYAVWLTRKTRALLAEVEVLLGRAVELGDLLAQIEAAPEPGRTQARHTPDDGGGRADHVRVLDDDLRRDRAT